MSTSIRSLFSNRSILLLAASLATVVLGPGCATRPGVPEAAIDTPAAQLAPLPEMVTSFGAVTVGDWLYAFGGHRGERHEYSAEMVSGSLSRLRLSDGRVWESLPASTPGQGLALVAFDGCIYRVGGMAARNPAGAQQDLYSQAIVQKFDPRRNRWEEAPSLPTPRSSHDAVVVGSRLYAMGGWQMMGGTNRSLWPANALVLDLARPGSGWREFSQPFQRRALALAALESRVYCIGGMDSDNKPTLSVDIYDTVSGQWSKGPDLPPGKFKGFGCSAIAQDGRIYATAFQGDLLRLSADRQAWEVVGRLEHPRMAHRLVTAGTTQLIALGGDDGEAKRPDLELLSPSNVPPTAIQAVSSSGPVAPSASRP